jgi:transglutaminase-like putative cysteine protease
MPARAGRAFAAVKLASASATQVTYLQLKSICLCLALTLAAYAAALPPWILLVACAAGAIRLILAARGYGAPGRAIRLGIAVAAFVVLFLELHTFNGLPAGSALLSLVAGLKLLETQSRRDLYVVSFAIYFLCLSALLRSESFWLFAYLVGVSWLTTATLLRLTPAPPLPGLRASLSYAGRLSAQALPIALILWLFFPRLDTPFWRVPPDNNVAETGLSDSMSPGDIIKLALSDEVAFRVRFDGPAPPPAELYWRGPVLHDFDGRTWRRTTPVSAQAPALVGVGAAYRYVLSLEPSRHNWIFALDWPDRWDLAAGSLTGDYMLVQSAPLSRPVDVTAVSHTRVRTGEPLTDSARGRDLELPTARNPRTLAFARELRRAHPDDRDYARAVLDLFRREAFFYTLEPPPLGADSVDEFLFDTRRGFCGHYASAFAAMMRAAGIPARVVTGYQGGLYNQYGGYRIVHQSDAHAWNEIWIDGTGWVRFDPTSAISPARVDHSIAETLAGRRAAAGSWQHFAWFSNVRLELDALGQLWRQRILQFNQFSQLQLLASLGIPEPDGQKIVMLMGGGLALAFAWLTWQLRREQRPRPKDPLVRAYGSLCRKLAAVGLPRKAHEGAETFAARVALERPDLARTVTALCRRYARLRYGPQGSREAALSFASGVRTFRPRRRA